MIIMGNAETDNESKYIEIVYENYTTKSIKYYAEFEKAPFAEGSFRYAYRGQIKDRYGTRPYYFPKGKCVVKVLKEKYARNVRSYEEDLKNIFYSSKIAKLFNSEYSYYLNYEIRFVQPYIAKFDKYGFDRSYFIFWEKNQDSMKKIGKSEYLFIEPYLEGYYQKFINNNMMGITNLEEIFNVFMHWNWIYSKGKKIIGDIQGVKKYNYYELTDPAVQSIEGEYGSTDLGVLSLYAFVAQHKHNKYCQHLSWPNDALIKKMNSEIYTIINYYELGMLNITNLTKFYYDEVLEPVFYEKTTKQIIFGVIVLLITYFLEYAFLKFLTILEIIKNFL